MPTGRLNSFPHQYSSKIDKHFVPSSIIPSKYTGTGCVLLSQPNESDQFLMQSAILIFSDSEKYGVQGVVFDKPSAFKMGDSMKVHGPFDGNPLFMGGNGGGDMAIMLHKRALPSARALGHGIFLGGMPQATELIDHMMASPKEFKFIFNYVSWKPGCLEKEVNDNRWDVCLVPPDLILSQKHEGIWFKARLSLSHNERTLNSIEK